MSSWILCLQQQLSLYWPTNNNTKAVLNNDLNLKKKYDFEIIFLNSLDKYFNPYISIKKML